MLLQIEEKRTNERTKHFCFVEILSVECTGRQRGYNRTIKRNGKQIEKHIKSCIVAVVSAVVEFRFGCVAIVLPAILW